MSVKTDHDNVPYPTVYGEAYESLVEGAQTAFSAFKFGISSIFAVASSVQTFFDEVVFDSEKSFEPKYVTTVPRVPPTLLRGQSGESYPGFKDRKDWITGDNAIREGLIRDSIDQRQKRGHYDTCTEACLNALYRLGKDKKIVSRDDALVPESL